MPIKLSKLEIVDNAGPNSVKAALKASFASARNVDIEVAFASEAGLEALLPSLRKVAERPGAKVRFLVGIYQRITTPAALRALLSVQNETDKRIEVRLAFETHFHRKLYLSRTPTSFTFLVGSSNLTKDGLLSGGEINLLVSLSAKSARSKQLLAIFDGDWEHGSVPLTRSNIKAYAELGGSAKAKGISKADLKKILGAGASHSKADDDVDHEVKREPLFWKHGIAGFVKKQTEAVIADETNWDRWGWDWCSSYTSRYKRGDLLLYVDRSGSNRWVHLAEIKGVVGRTATSTPDGRVFVAHVQLGRTRRRQLNKQTMKELRAAGVSSDATPEKLSRKTWEMLRPMFASPSR